MSEPEGFLGEFYQMFKEDLTSQTHKIFKKTQNIR